MQELFKKALEARHKAYVPYSHFAVGAALLTEEGLIYQGCNIENAAYSPSVCAERTAIFKAVSEGHLKFKALAVCGGPDDKEPRQITPPCGVCREVMSEFCGPDFDIYLVKSETEAVHLTLKELLPYSFSLEECSKD